MSRKTRKRYRLTVLIIVAAVATASIFFSCGGEDGRSVEETTKDNTTSGGEDPAGEGEQESSNKGPLETSIEGINFKWKIENGNITCTVEAPTEGWVAVGFKPSKMMKDANFIIGYVEDGDVSIRDDFGNWFTSHDADVNLGGTDDVSNIGGAESEGKTIIEFTIPLDSGDDYDQVITPGEKMTVIFAYGDNDGFDKIHKKTAKTTATF